MRQNSAARTGFTLIELLVVIAIIAILAAILFPVFNAVREDARKTTCMGDLHAIAEAVRLYKEDTGKYPPVLSSYAYKYDPTAPIPSTPTTLTKEVPYDGTGKPVDMDQVLPALRPLGKEKNIQSKTTFFCPDELPQPATNAVSTAVYPIFSGAQSNGGITLSGTVNVSFPQTSGPPTVLPGYFYTADSYTTGPGLDASGNLVVPVRRELHYSLDWTGTVGAGDAPNQLKYPNPPPDRTVITWCPYHTAVAHNTIIPVLLLNGTVKAVPANQFMVRGPLNFVP